MTHLNIQQGLNVEVVSTNLIKKLYEAALSVPEPLEGEQDAAYMSGNLLVDKSYRSLVEYLTNRFDDLHINVTGSYYIPFEDSAVLNVLLANNIGSDGIGVTEAEAANATLTAAMFLNNTDITSFDEFKYFTKANTNPPNLLFMGCNNLSSIDLSNVTKCSNEEFKNSGLTGTLNLPNLTSIGQYAFNGSRITNITDLGSITSVPGMCFNNCDSLTTVTLPNSCTSIGGGAFAYCDALQSIDFGGVTTIDQQAFINDPALATVTGTSNLTSIGSATFLNCSNISGALDLSNAVTIGINAFYNTHISSVILSKAETIDFGAFANTNISSITLPSTLRRVHAQFVNFCPIEKIIIPEGCTTIIGGLFNTKNKALKYWEIPSTVTDMGFFFHNSFISSIGGYDQNSLYLVIKASTPPTLTYYSNLTGATYAQYCAGIYVPDASLLAYQNAGDAWQHASVQAKLKPISQLLTDSPTWWAEYLTRASF